MVIDQGEERTRERCIMCLAWHEPGEHVGYREPPETLTGQVPVSGNPEVSDDDQ
jgi:hypothetical protein